MKNVHYNDAKQIMFAEGDVFKVVPNTDEAKKVTGVAAWEAEGNEIKEPPTFASKEEALTAVNKFAQGFTETITGPVPLDEKLSWDAKYAAALAVKENTATSDQETLINDEAVITGEDMIDLANVIIAKAKMYKRIVSRVAGLRRAMTAQIEAESDPYKYEDILNAGKIKAGELAAELGLSVS
ncbi:MAG: hypothetical protein ABJO86_00615 [Lentilitoribacter sp.]